MAAAPPGHRRQTRWAPRHRVVVRNSGVAEQDGAHAAAGRVEQIRPVTLYVPVLQQVEAQPVPVEAQAGFEVADHDHGMMNASGYGTQG